MVNQGEIESKPRTKGNRQAKHVAKYDGHYSRHEQWLSFLRIMRGRELRRHKCERSFRAFSHR